MDDLLTEFLAESAENLTRLDLEIVQLEQRPDDRELLKSIFRTIHTIKGTCGFLGLARLEHVAHAAEDVLGLLRDGTLPLQPEIVSDVLAAIDTIKAILEVLESTGEEPAGADVALIEQLRRWSAEHLPEEVALDDIAFPFPVVTASAGGSLAAVAATPDASDAGSSATEAKAAAEPTPRPEAPSPPAPPAARNGERGSDAPEPAERENTQGPVAQNTLRVGVGILDLLMNLAGELVLTRNQLVQLAERDDESPFLLPLQHLNRVTSELQEAVMKTRLQPIGNAWGKLPRLVRDLARTSGKQIELAMSGAETELDRQILQALGDPLTHMVRNSADHGIESIEARRAAGKPEHGTIGLNAFHEGGYIVIEVRDDGKGLDAAAIRSRAVERGLVRQEDAASLTDTQVFSFVFEPGFSTAEKVTSVSGRGVGMDVVRSNIESIGGTIELQSVRGRGTTIRIKLPLTLAILSALIVDVAETTFAIPQICVVELVRLSGDAIRNVQNLGGASVFRLRESLLPLVRLSEALGCAEPCGAGELEGASIVVCQLGTQRFGLVVDRIVDTQEIVVKPLGRMLKQVPYYSGTTILGDGRVIMIVDVPGIAVRAQIDKAEEGRAERADTATDAGDSDRTIALVVFSAGGEAPRAVPLALVSRLEKIPVAQIEKVDGRWLVQYRGGLLPLIPASEHIRMRDLPERPVIVFTDGERSMGLAVDEIHDVAEDRLQIDADSATPGLLGAAVIAGRSTEVVDIHFFLREADPLWFRRHVGRSQRRRVLIVDDSQFFLNVVGPALRSVGYEVSSAGDGSEALERLERGEHYDVIVSDIDMPGVDGWEFATRMRQHPSWGEIPMLALTGRSSESDRQRALQVGYRDFLAKFDRDKVLEAVHNAVSEEVPA